MGRWFSVEPAPRVSPLSPFRARISRLEAAGLDLGIGEGRLVIRFAEGEVLPCLRQALLIEVVRIESRLHHSDGLERLVHRDDGFAGRGLDELPARSIVIGILAFAGELSHGPGFELAEPEVGHDADVAVVQNGEERVGAAVVFVQSVQALRVAPVVLVAEVGARQRDREPRGLRAALVVVGLDLAVESVLLVHELVPVPDVEHAGDKQTDHDDEGDDLLHDTVLLT